MKRTDFGLADLFGCTFKGKVEGPMQNSYLRLEHEAAPGHPLLKGLEDAPRIINGVWRLEVEPREQVRQYAAHANSFLSRSADGKSLSACGEDRQVAVVSA